MISLVHDKAVAAGADHVNPVVSSAEDLTAPDGAFELVTVGNAFHRLRRETIASNIYGLLQPGGCLALLWADSPWRGDRGWQIALSKILERWKTGDRVPADWEQARERRPDRLVVAEAGFEPLGAPLPDPPAVPRAWRDRDRWTADELVGFVYSTSFLSPPRPGPVRGRVRGRLSVRARPLGPQRGPVADHRLRLRAVPAADRHPVIRGVESLREPKAFPAAGALTDDDPGQSGQQHVTTEDSYRVVRRGLQLAMVSR